MKSSACDLPVREINPPQLTQVHLGRHIVCHRPMRLDAPKMQVDITDHQLVAHNYGHGGSGWTLAPGAVRYVNDQLFAGLKLKNFDKNSAITIVGAGIIGLLTASDLISNGYNNITIIADNFHDTTSHHAGGLIALSSMTNDSTTQKLIEMLAHESFKYYQKNALDKKNSLSLGIKQISVYSDTHEDLGMQTYINQRLMKPGIDVILDFKNGTKRSMIAYDTGLFVNTHFLMDYFYSQLHGRVQFVERTLINLQEIKTPVIVNCSGMGAGQLSHDLEMVSVQGHLIMLTDQNPRDLDYIIVTKGVQEQTQSGFDVRRSFYIIPKKVDLSEVNEIGVIGGTFIKACDSSIRNESEFGIVVENAKKFYGI